MENNLFNPILDGKTPNGNIRLAPFFFAAGATQKKTAPSVSRYAKYYETATKRHRIYKNS